MHKWYFEKPNIELRKTHLSAIPGICKLHTQISSTHVLCPWPVSQDAVIKNVYTSPGLQCSSHSNYRIRLLEVTFIRDIKILVQLCVKKNICQTFNYTNVKALWIYITRDVIYSNVGTLVLRSYTVIILKLKDMNYKYIDSVIFIPSDISNSFNGV